jgi:CTP:molybdopterin cytidylyltransferase MocA
MCTASVALLQQAQGVRSSCAKIRDRYPLDACCAAAGTVKALLPVGNRPLISYPLRNLAEAGIKSCIVVRETATATSHQEGAASSQALILAS